MPWNEHRCPVCHRTVQELRRAGHGGRAPCPGARRTVFPLPVLSACALRAGGFSVNDDGERRPAFVKRDGHGVRRDLRPCRRPPVHPANHPADDAKEGA